MNKFEVGVIGASGYAGGELVRLIDDHPAMELSVIAGHTSADKRLGEVHPHLPGGERILTSIESALDADVALMFLALPHGASAPAAVALEERGVTVVDLGADFRLHSADAYREAYGADHAFPAELGQWPYGLVELNRAQIAAADVVAVPGCYPTSVILALAPLVSAGLIDPTAIVVDSMSGVSGAGRAVKDHLTFGAIDQSVRAYAVANHRHRPEMEQAIAETGGVADVVVSFTPHLVPMQRGLLSTCSAPAMGGAGAEDLAAALHKAYDDERFVDVVSEPPQTRWVVGSNRCLISVHYDSRSGRAIVVSALDNLVKGAAGQALQCANLMLGIDEAAGLPLDGWMP